MTSSQVYSQYRDIDNPVDKEKQLYKILPLFCKNCARYSGYELVSKFPEAFDFAEGVSLLFVRHVTQLAQASNPARYHSQYVCVCGVFTTEDTCYTLAELKFAFHFVLCTTYARSTERLLLSLSTHVHLLSI